MQPQAPIQTPEASQATQPVQTSITQSAAIKQTPIKKLGVTIFSSKIPGLLEWSADNRIRLYLTDPATNQQQLQFDCAPNEIHTFASNVGIVTLKPVNGKRHYLEMTPDIGNKIFIGHLLFILAGIVGEAIALYKFYRPALKDEAASDYPQWQAALAPYRVRSSWLSLSAWCSVVKVILILQIVGLVIAVALLAIGLTMAITSGQL